MYGVLNPEKESGYKLQENPTWKIQKTIKREGVINN